MGYRSLARVRRRPASDTGSSSRSTRRSTRTWRRPPSSGRVYQAGGPALLFRRVKGTAFPMVGNLFGTIERARFLFRDTLEPVRRLVELKVDPGAAARHPWRYRGAARARSGTCCRGASVAGRSSTHQTTIDRLPAAPVAGRWTAGRSSRCRRSTPRTPTGPAWRRSNLGMYRVQLSGQRVRAGPRGRPALPDPPRDRRPPRGGDPPRRAAAGERLRRRPAGADGRRGDAAARGAARAGLRRGARRPAGRGWSRPTGACRCPPRPTSCITGTIDPHAPQARRAVRRPPRLLQPGARLPGAARRAGLPPRRARSGRSPSVGRPPQEDTTFGALIHELTGPIIPTVIPGVHAVHAVDAAGVHPLLLAIGSERYVPYADRPPAAGAADAAPTRSSARGSCRWRSTCSSSPARTTPTLDIHDIPAFFRHVLERVDWTNDLHFQTRTTIDTLDYSGHGLNQGSKVVIAAAGPAAARRCRPSCPPACACPTASTTPASACPGILAVQGPALPSRGSTGVAAFCRVVRARRPDPRLPADRGRRRQRVRRADR